jgi:hypothetical protein
VSLEGTLETIALPDVLALLSVTAKTGELRIEAIGGVGSVWFDAGGIAGFDVGNQRTAVDALFALLRLKEGSFKFHTGTRPLNAMPPQDVSPLLEEAEDRLGQWPGIAAAVPALDCELFLQSSVDGTVMLRPDQWQLVAAIGGGHNVAAVLDARGLAEFDGCRALKELVDLRLVRVVTPPPAPAPETVPELVAPAVQDLDHEAYEDEVQGEDGQVVADEVGGTLEDAVQGASTYANAEAEAEPEEVYTPPEEPYTPYPMDEVLASEEWASKPGPEVTDLSEIWDDETGDVIRSSDVQNGSDGASAEPEPEVVVPEPVNRGLLLKFLGSARN